MSTNLRRKKPRYKMRTADHGVSPNEGTCMEDKGFVDVSRPKYFCQQIL